MNTETDNKPLDATQEAVVEETRENVNVPRIVEPLTIIDATFASPASPVVPSSTSKPRRAASNASEPKEPLVQTLEQKVVKSDSIVEPKASTAESKLIANESKASLGRNSYIVSLKGQEAGTDSPPPARVSPFAGTRKTVMSFLRKRDENVVVAEDNKDAEVKASEVKSNSDKRKSFGFFKRAQVPVISNPTLLPVQLDEAGNILNGSNAKLVGIEPQMVSKGKGELTKRVEVLEETVKQMQATIETLVAKQ